MAVKFFDKSTSNCFLVLQGKFASDLTDVSGTFNGEAIPVTTFDSAFAAAYVAGTTDWSIDASGLITDTAGTGWKAYTGSTAANTITGSTNFFDLQTMQQNRQTVTFCVRLDSGFLLRGSVIITSLAPKFSTGKPGTFSIKLQGTGSILKSAT